MRPYEGGSCYGIISENGQPVERSLIKMAVFDILMVVALGTLAGTIIGLLIGSLARRQQSVWEEMTKKERAINIALVLFFSLICTAGLAWYALF
jgi:NhaP-type Na+/H+ or K+/H+ antiporter